MALASRPRLDFEYALLPGALSHPYTWEHVFVTVFHDCGVVGELSKSEREREEQGHGGGWLCPENGQTMGPYWIIPTSLARPSGANLH